MCIVHKGFSGFRSASPASILGGNLIGLKPAIPYDTIHSTLWLIPHSPQNFSTLANVKFVTLRF